MEYPSKAESIRASAIRTELVQVLENIELGHEVATGGKVSLPLPRLSVEGVGLIPLPLQAREIQALISKSEQAPFGQGSKTIVDESVRNCRQIDPSKVTVSTSWSDAVGALAISMAEKIGVHNRKIVAKLYKVVLYPPGGFFVTHRDTERESGMFGSLVVQLPSVFTGGELLVRHAGKEQKFDFSKDGDVEFHAVAFYADCEHELKKIQSGYRLCMLYNLLRVDNGRVPNLSGPKEIQDSLELVANLWENVGAQRDEAIKNLPEILGMRFEHKYTEMNLSFIGLKGRDSAVVRTLRECKRFCVSLVLAEQEIEGFPEYMTGCECEASGPRVPMDIDIQECDISVLKLVADEDCDVDISGIDLEEIQMLTGGGIIDNNDAFDVKGGEYTGNEGHHSVECKYREAVALIWPRALSAKIASGLDGSQE